MLLATTGTDRISRLWDVSSVADGRCSVSESGRLIGESYSSPSVAFNADGKQLALVDLMNVRLRNSVDLTLVATLAGDLYIYDLAFSPDNHWLAVAEHHDTVALWDLTRPASPHSNPLSPSEGNPKTYVWRVAFSPNSSLLAAGASDGTLALWDLTTLQLTKTFHLPKAVSALSFSPDRKYLAAGCLDATVWLFPTAQQR